MGNGGGVVMVCDAFNFAHSLQFKYNSNTNNRQRNKPFSLRPPPSKSFGLCQVVI